MYSSDSNSDTVLPVAVSWCGKIRTDILLGHSEALAPVPEGSHTPGKLLWFGAILTLFALHSEGGAWASKTTPETWSVEDEGKSDILEIGPRHLYTQHAFSKCLLGYSFITAGLLGQKGTDAGSEPGEGRREQKTISLFFIFSFQATRVWSQWKSISCLLSSVPKGKRVGL